MSVPILYSGTRNASSWAMRAWLALREAGIEFSEEIIDIRRPQRFTNLARIGTFSPVVDEASRCGASHLVRRLSHCARRGSAHDCETSWFLNLRQR